MRQINIITLRVAQAALAVTFLLTAPTLVAATIAYGGTALHQLANWLMAAPQSHGAAATIPPSATLPMQDYITPSY